MGERLFIDEQVITELTRTGIDPSGEEGEYHTMVFDGPIFSFPVHIQHGDRVLRDGYCFLDIMEKPMHQRIRLSTARI